MSEVLGLMLSLIGDSSLLLLGVYYVITLSDLECDYINAAKCCERLNYWFLPDVIGHICVAVALLFTWHIWLFLLNLPILFWLINRVLSKPSGDIGFYDPTEIHNRHNLKAYMKHSMIKLGFHLVMFFIYLYCLILSLVSWDGLLNDAGKFWNLVISSIKHLILLDFKLLSYEWDDL